MKSSVSEVCVRVRFAKLVTHRKLSKRTPFRCFLSGTGCNHSGRVGINWDLEDLRSVQDVQRALGRVPMKRDLYKRALMSLSYCDLSLIHI